MSNHTSEVIEIQLTQSQTTIIDSKHRDLLDRNWYAVKSHSGTYYAAGTIRTPDSKHKQKRIWLARVIMERMLGRELEKGELVDHKDGTLDNREQNLRLATPKQNSQNRKLNKNSTSGYKGVSWHKVWKKWGAHIMINGKLKFLGNYATPELAYEAYCKAALEHFGEFARLE